MEAQVAIDMLQKLGVDNPSTCVSSLQDGATSLIPTSSGATLALLRHGDSYDSLLVGSQSTGSVFPLRAVLEDAFLPLSERYASKVGVALPQRDAIRKRIREAAVALDVIASGRLVSVSPPDFPVHTQLKQYIENDNSITVDQLPESFINDLTILNQLQTNVLTWSKEIDRVVNISRKGPGSVLTTEEETVFWSSLDLSLSIAEKFINSSIVKITLDILSRKRRATGFLIETSVTLSNARRNSASVLNLIQGLPLIDLRSAENLIQLKEAVIKLLEHIASKIRGSSFSVNRSLSLVYSMGDDVTNSMSRILSSNQFNLFSIPFNQIAVIIEQCCELFEAWSNGFDVCRKVIRDVARLHGESLPPRSKTRMSTVYSHLTEIYELRADHHSLRSLLLELLKDHSNSSSQRIEILDNAYTSLIDITRSIDHFKMTGKEENKWYESVNVYKKQIKQVEHMICSDYTDIVERASSLSSLANIIIPFSSVVEKPFMSTCVEDAIPYILRLGSKELKLLQSRERLINLRDTRKLSDGLPVICIVLFECLQICSRASSIIDCIESIVGKTRMKVMADLNDFVNVVQQLENKVQPMLRFSNWLKQIPSKLPDERLFHVVDDSKLGKKRLSVNLNAQVAFFTSVYSMKTMFPQAPFSKDHAELARFTSKINPVFTDLRQSLRCYDMVMDHLQSLNEKKRERLFPFIMSMLKEGETIMVKGFKLSWNSDLLELSTFASDLLKSCSLLHNTYHLLLENDDGLQLAIDRVEGIEPEFEEERLSTSIVKDLKADVFDAIRGHRISLLALFSQHQVDQYLKNHWYSSLCATLSKLMSKILNSLFQSLSSGKASQLQISLVVSQQENESSLSCIPTIAAAEHFLINCIGEIYSALRTTVEHGFVNAGMSLEKAHECTLHILSNPAMSKLSVQPSGVNPFQIISQEVEQALSSIDKWNPYIHYVHAEGDLEFQTERKEKNQDVFTSLAQLAEVHDSVPALQKDWDSSEKENIIISVDSTVLSRKILSNIKESIRKYAESCGTESANLSQELYQKISNAKQSLQNISPTDVLKVVVSLQGMREDVLPNCRKMLEDLISREQVFERITNNILKSSVQLMRSTETWVRSVDLKPYLDDLEHFYEQRNNSAMKDKSALMTKYEDLRKLYQSRMTTIFSDFQNIRGKDCSHETYLGLEELLQDLEHQLKELEAEALDVERLAKALSVDSTVDRNGPRGILIELKRLRESLERLGQISKQLETLGACNLSKADIDDIDSSLNNYRKDVEEITLQTGSNREAIRIKNQLSSCLKQLPLLRALHSVELSPPRERDVLKRLFGDANHKEGLQQTSLKALWDVDILSHEDYLKGVFEVAAGEALICDFLRDVERKWSARRCQFLYRGDVPLLQGISLILDEIEEHMQALDTMKASSHAKLFESDRAAWEKRLALAHEKLELMADVQSRWAHLRTLFASKSSPSAPVNPLGELHEEIASFANVHARFSSVGMLLSNSPGIIEGLEADLGLEEMQEELKGIVRGLSRFLEKQRTQFPRFFFLSDDDLLHVLSVSSSNLEGLQPHIPKLFSGVAKLYFETVEKDVRIISVESSEGEVVKFLYPVIITGKPIVSWLQDVQNGLRCLLKECLKKAAPKISSLYGDPSKSTDSLLKVSEGVPVQVAILALRICFTTEIDLCLDNASSAPLELEVARKCIERNLSAVCATRECPQYLGITRRVFLLLRDQLTKEFVYQRDLVINLLAQDFSQGGDYVLQNELRFYMDSSGNNFDDLKVVVKCSCASFNYGWEYLGVGDALVRTTLTSRCYLILSEAMRRGFGGSPSGPAGTGKTETVKALGKALGRFVSVFNCDESFDSVSVGRILAGACRIGCWVCFDEFNRLSSSSLSSTSGQLAALQDAIKKNETEIPNFYGGNLRVKVVQGFAIFVTMNPTYTGRRELPTNLKSLFRPCTMSKPDTQPIAEVMLLSENFKYSTVLSEKLVTLFSALKSSLTEQSHYDFGLRSLKSTIIACGSILESISDGGLTENRSVGQEEDVIVRGVGEILKPKLDVDDVWDYNRLVFATFSEASKTDSGLPSDLEEAMNEAICHRRLVPDNIFLDKIRQLYSLLQHHCGVMMVGSTATGKSGVWRVLYDSMKAVMLKRHSNSSGNVKMTRASLTVIDAKLLSARELYGSLDTLTREWSDGLFTKTLRSISEERATEPEGVFPLHWIVFDGDVDPDWIETLNSVLDDNRILTLPSGEQIPFLPNTRIIVETDHLRHANPSSVSRCGMVCFGGYSFALSSFSSRLVETIRSIAPSFKVPSFVHELTRLAYELALFVLDTKSFIMDVSLQSLLESFLVLVRNSLENLLSGRDINRLSSEIVQKRPSHSLDLSNDLVIKTFLTCTVKAMGAGLTNSSRFKLSNKFLQDAREIPEVDSCLQGIMTPCLADVAVLSNGDFLEYSELLGQASEDRIQRDIASPDVVIPTPTTLRLEHLLREGLNLSSKKANNSCPLILCGPPGSGKSMLLMSALRETPNVSLATLSFSSETTPANILTSLKGHTTITKRPNGTFVLHPKSAGFRVILFCDEVNLEKPDRYETQTSVALLRSLAEHGGFWTGSPPYWVSIEGVQIVAACNPSDDTGRHRLAPRFLRHCFVIRVEEPTPTDLKIIYGTFNGAMLRRLNCGLEENNEQLTAAMVEFYARNKLQFSPPGRGPIEAHYIYSPRDLSRWTRGMSMLLSDSENDSLVNQSLSGKDKEDAWVDVIRAFCYEARRLFRDRLVKEEDRVYVESQLLDVLRSFMNTNLQSVPEFLYTSWLDQDDSSEVEGRNFQVVQFSQDFRSMIYEKLRVFSEEQGLGGTWIGGLGDGQVEDNNTVDQFAVTDDVLTHLTRIERILCQPLGHAVLMGAPGTGKKTLARFAAWMLSVEVHQVRSHSSYTEQEFAKDLRDILRRASVDNRQMLMIFDESHAMETAFLEMMNSLLACGEVPGLFSGDERVRLLEDLRQVSSQISSTEQALYSEFVRRIRLNLHIIFTISLISPSNLQNINRNSTKRIKTLSELSRRSPALYNRCTVDWIGDWGRETLAAVAELKLDVLNTSELEMEKISHCTVEIHTAASHFIEDTDNISIGITPRHYLEFIEQFNRIVLEKGGAIEKGVERYRTGVSKLRAAGEAVEDLKEDLSIKAEDLRIKEIHANEMLQNMVEEQRRAEKSKVEAEQLATAAEEASNEAKLRENEVNIQLSEVLPKIEAARKAVGLIRKENLEELRAMPNPPEAVRLALEAVVMMLDGSIPTTPNINSSAGRSNTQLLPWGSIRARMRSSEFISSVVSFDGESLSKGMRNKIINRIINNPSFDVNKISYASRAAGPLAEWTLAVLDYLDVQDSIEPLEQEIMQLQGQQDAFLERQEKSLEKAFEFKERIEECRNEYAKLISEAERIRQDIKDSENNLTKAEKMLDSLGEEWNRWIKDMKKLNSSADTVWGDAVFSAAFIAYAGSLDYINRMKLCTTWRNIIIKNQIAFDQNLSISNYLTTPEQRGIWSTNGLPTDPSSLENYAILRRSARFPLIIDPTRGCSELLKYVLKVPGHSNDDFNQNNKDGKNIDNQDNGDMRIAITSFSITGKKSYIRSLESAIRFGTIIILEDAEYYDRVVTPLLGQEVFYGDNNANSNNTINNSNDKQQIPNQQQQDAIGLNSERGQTTNRNSTNKFTKNICQRIIRLGNRDVYLNNKFCMFLTANDIENVPYSAITRCNVVSFKLSYSALGTTCVSRSLKIMKPEIEKRRYESLTIRIENENKKRKLEEKVLSTINENNDLGTSLLNGSLLEDLKTLKEDVFIINEKQKDEIVALKEIEQKQKQFNSLGQLSIHIFSIIQNLLCINPIYKFNTQFFLNLFDSAIHHCVHNNKTSLHLCQITLLQFTLTTILPCLFPKDRLPFAAALTLISLKDDLLTDQELLQQDEKIINSSNDGDEMDKGIENIQLFRKACYESLSRLEKMIKGQEIQTCKETISLLPEEFKEYFSNDENMNVMNVHDSHKPNTSNNSKYKSEIWQSIMKIIESSIESPEELIMSIERLICIKNEFKKIVQSTNIEGEERLKTLIEKFRLNKEKKYQPILLCLQGDGCDPSPIIMEYNNDSKMNIISIAISSNINEETISNVLDNANKKCNSNKRIVVYIKNIHLINANKLILNRIFSEINKHKGYLSCLLILSIEISSQFSKDIIISLSSSFYTLAFELASSFRINFSLTIEKLFNLHNSNLKHRLNNIVNINYYYQFYILLSWLHASILERNLHCPIGFIKHYDFSDNDLIAAFDIFIQAINQNKNVHITSIIKLLLNCVYGSRIENDHDYEILNCLISDLFLNIKNNNTNNNDTLTLTFENDEVVQIPIKHEQLSQFIENMPVNSNAKWYKMPENTAIVSQTKNGVETLRKLLILSNGKYDNDEKVNEEKENINISFSNNNDTNNNNDNMMSTTNKIMEIFNKIPEEVSYDDSNREKLTPLNRFMQRESKVLNIILRQLKEETTQLQESVILKNASTVDNNNINETIEIQRLKQDIIEIIQSNRKTIPKQWYGLYNLLSYGKKEKQFNTNINVTVYDFIKRLNSCKMMNIVMSSQHKNQHTEIDMRGIIRHQALITALRYEEAERRGISPHELHAAVIHKNSSSINIEEYENENHFSMKGIRLNGGEWDIGMRVFKINNHPPSSSSSVSLSKKTMDHPNDRDSEPTSVDDTFIMKWRTKDEKALNERDFVSIQMYGREDQQIIWNLQLVIESGSAPSEWRLNGASFNLL